MSSTKQTLETEKQLLVLCCHQPSLDPRIGWSAKFGKDNGYNTKILGFSHADKGQAPSNLSVEGIDEIVFAAQDPSLSPKRIFSLMIKNGVVPTARDCIVFAFPALLVSLIYALLWAVKHFAQAIRALYKCIRFLPKGQALLNYSRLYYRRYFQTWILRIAGAPRKVWRLIFRGRFSEWVEALRGYKWYFKDHMLGFSACVLFWAETEGYKPDIIHAHDPDSLLAAILLKAKYGCRVVYDAHEYGPDAYLIRPKPRVLFFAFERMMFKHVDAAVTVSPELKKKFETRFPNLPFAVLPNASPKGEGKFITPANSDIEGLARGRVSVLFQGGFAKHRGVEWVIKEWEALRPENAALFFRGPDNAYRDGLIKCAKETGLLGGSIYFLDSIAEGDLIAFASVGDIGIIPYHSFVENHYGACPNKLSQYMHAGLAVMTTPLPYVKSILELADCGVVYDDTVPGDFGEKLSDLLSDSNQIKLFGASGRRYALRKFNYDEFGKILLNLYLKTPT